MTPQRTVAPRAKPKVHTTPPTPRPVPWSPPAVPTPSATANLTRAVFLLVLVLSDVLAISGALFGTYFIRFHAKWLPAPLGVPDLAFYAASLSVVVPVGLTVAYLTGLYRPSRPATAYHDALGGGRAVVQLVVLLAALAFFYRGFSYSRAFLVGFGALYWVLFLVFRRGARLLQVQLLKRGVGVERIGIVGGGVMARQLAEKIQVCRGSGAQVVAELDKEDWPDANGDEVERPLRVSRVRSFARVHHLDRVVVTDPTLTHDERLDLVEACHLSGVNCEFVPDLFELIFGRARVQEFDGVPLIGCRLHPLGHLDRIKKRTLDVVVSAVALVVLLPLFGLIAVAVKLDSRGPAIFRQPRLGRDGREFCILKFRSMRPDAERASGPVRAAKNDPRPTRVGSVLRRTSLDELPQLWNVLKGEMSLVGPRPERRHFVEEFQRSIPRYLERLGVKSGLTGWAQVNGLRGNTSIAERTRHDIWYVQNWSLRLDIKIMILTLFRFLFQDEAY